MDVNRQARKQILQACHSFLVPVARFLLRSGISYREFAEVCQVAFVEVARDDFGIRGRPTNTSRVAAMTGIARKEVARLRQILDQYDVDARARLSPLSDVLHVWHTNKKYLDDARKPLALPLEGKISFEGLVKECAHDVPAGAVRVELTRYGAVVSNESGLLIPVRREVVPDTFDEKLVSSLSFNLAGLAHTIAYNSDPNRMGPGRIERFVQSDEISEDAKMVLRPIVREEVEQFSRGIDDLFGPYTTRQTGNKGRIGVGVYYFEDSETS